MAGANLRLSAAPVGNSHFQIGCLFVEYGLFNTTNLIQNLIYIRFGIILTQFFLNFSRHITSDIYFINIVNA